MIRVAIVGNIASGKSQVEKILLDLGYKVADTDKINHEILKSDIETINEIKNTFSNDDILENNAISREKLGKIVFANKEKKEQLESILHKRIFEKVEEFFKENKNEKLVFVAIPLLFETKQEKTFDKIIFISADKETRLKRLIERNNYTKEYALSRINSQMDEKEKIKKSDYIIKNDSSIEVLEKRIKNILYNFLLQL